MSLRKQCLATVLVGVALAAPAGPAVADGSPAVARHDLTYREREAIASRGIGAPTPPVIEVSGPVARTSSGGGFDWGAAGVGVATFAGLIALAGGLGVVRRSRVTPKGRLL
jgi:hypothetical protein